MFYEHENARKLPNTLTINILMKRFSQPQTHHFNAIFRKIGTTLNGGGTVFDVLDNALVQFATVGHLGSEGGVWAPLS